MNPFSTKSPGSSLWVLDDLLLVVLLMSPEVFVEDVHRDRWGHLGGDYGELTAAESCEDLFSAPGDWSI